MTKNLRISKRELKLVGASDTDPYFLNLETQNLSQFEIMCAALLTRGDEVVLDVGANIGVTAAVLSQYAGLVHAFEPGITVFKALMQNIEQNQLQNIKAVNVAVSNITGSINFCEHYAYGHIVKNPSAPAVHCVTIDDFVEKNSLKQVDLIKIDVEGFEKHVLEGAKHTIAQYSPIVLLEFNCWCLTAYGRINPLEFAEQILGEFKYIFLITLKNSEMQLRRLSPEDAIAFVHETMVSGRCWVDLILTNNDNHIRSIKSLIN
jgi:FkbM family methyltransferase